MVWGGGTEGHDCGGLWWKLSTHESTSSQRPGVRNYLHQSMLRLDHKCDLNAASRHHNSSQYSQHLELKAVTPLIMLHLSKHCIDAHEYMATFVMNVGCSGYANRMILLCWLYCLSRTWCRVNLKAVECGNSIHSCQPRVCIIWRTTWLHCPWHFNTFLLIHVCVVFMVDEHINVTTQGGVKL